MWLQSVPILGLILGDFNDSIWGKPEPTHLWHHRLENVGLQDPVLAYAPSSDPNTLFTHNKGRRLDTNLVTPAFWEVNP